MFQVQKFKLSKCTASRKPPQKKHGSFQGVNQNTISKEYDTLIRQQRGHTQIHSEVNAMHIDNDKRILPGIVKIAQCLKKVLL